MHLILDRVPPAAAGRDRRDRRPEARCDELSSEKQTALPVAEWRRRGPHLWLLCAQRAVGVVDRAVDLPHELVESLAQLG